MLVNIIYNLDLTTFIIEPIFETLLDSYNDLEMADMNLVIYQFPVDLDFSHVTWMSLFHQDKANGDHGYNDISVTLNKDPKTAMLLTKDQFLKYIDDFRLGNENNVPPKLHFPNYDKVHYYFAARRYFNSLNIVLNQFLLHIQVSILAVKLPTEHWEWLTGPREAYWAMGVAYWPVS